MKDTLLSFGRFLAERGLRFEATIIGGAALLVAGVIDRATNDVDCLDPDIPEPVQAAAREFAGIHRGPGAPLEEQWLNSGPKDLRNDLPPGWRERLVPLCSGPGITLHTLGRLDLLRTKLFAFCDRGQDEQDCVALAPTAEELRECLPWVTERDANPLWPAHVERAFRALAEELGHGRRP
ncbi:MAG TPA: hypothetical protein PK280_00345 [Planctomycetota bacterium]|nr:hypothetical protein [Planctomycetota bacterium]